MTDEQIIAALQQMRRHYDEGWTLHELQNDLENIFRGLEERETRVDEEDD